MYVSICIHLSKYNGIIWIIKKGFTQNKQWATWLHYSTVPAVPKQEAIPEEGGYLKKTNQKSSQTHYLLIWKNLNRAPLYKPPVMLIWTLGSWGRHQGDSSAFGSHFKYNSRRLVLRWTLPQIKFFRLWAALLEVSRRGTLDHGSWTRDATLIVGHT